MQPLEKEACRVMVSMLLKQRDADNFRAPVDPIALNIPDYLEIIKQPMDLKTVRHKVCSQQLLWSICLPHTPCSAVFTAFTATNHTDRGVNHKRNPQRAYVAASCMSTGAL